MSEEQCGGPGKRVEAMARIGDSHRKLRLHTITREKRGPGVSQPVVVSRKQAEAGFNGMFQKDKLAKCHKNES